MTPVKYQYYGPARHNGHYVPGHKYKLIIRQSWFGYGIEISVRNGGADVYTGYRKYKNLFKFLEEWRHA